MKNLRKLVKKKEKLLMKPMFHRGFRLNVKQNAEKLIVLMV